MFVATSSTIPMPSPLPVATSLSYLEYNSHAFPLPVATSLSYLEYNSHAHQENGYYVPRNWTKGPRRI